MMTGTPTPSADELWAILREVAVSQRGSTARLDRIEALTEANSAAIAGTRQLAETHARAIAQLRDENRASIEDLVTTRTTAAEQSARDRLALSAEVRSRVTALRDRFGGNGHASEG